MKNTEIKELTLTGLFIALTYVFTWIVKVQLPINAQGGLIHLGNVPFLIAALLLSRRIAMLSGSIGMGLFDLTSGWGTYAPITFLTYLVMGFIVHSITEKELNFKSITLAFIAATVIKISGYYIGEVFLQGSFISPIASIPGNLIQMAIAFIAVLVVLKPIKEALKYI